MLAADTSSTGRRGWLVRLFATAFAVVFVFFAGLVPAAAAAEALEDEGDALAGALAEDLDDEEDPSDVECDLELGPAAPVAQIPSAVPGAWRPVRLVESLRRGEGEARLVERPPADR